MINFLDIVKFSTKDGTCTDRFTHVSGKQPDLIPEAKVKQNLRKPNNYSTYMPLLQGSKLSLLNEVCT